MALRVLLADESPTIKKVFQLSLQDYGVEVKSVNVGGDVIDVANDFKPDIVFADVLLQQMSGYQVSSEMKVKPELKDIPIVLMWSGFMDIDEDKFQASHADAKLEKPFEVESLRNLIKGLVPKVQSQNLSDFLEFPELPEFDENKAKGKTEMTSAKKVDNSTLKSQLSQQLSPLRKTDKTSSAPSPTVSPLSNQIPRPISGPPPLKSEKKSEPQLDKQSMSLQKELQEADRAEKNSYWNMESFEAVNLTQKLPPRVTPGESEDREFLAENEEESDWVQSNIDVFKLSVPINDNNNVEEEEVPLEKIIPESAVEAATRASSLIPPLAKKKDNELDDIELEIEQLPEDKKLATFDINDLPQLSEERLTDLIRAQSKEIVERVVWQVVPEIATQIIERELKRLLAEQSDHSLR